MKRVRNAAIGDESRSRRFETARILGRRAVSRNRDDASYQIVLNRKRNQNAKIEKYKARLIVCWNEERGIEQEPSLPFFSLR